MYEYLVVLDHKIVAGPFKTASEAEQAKKEFPGSIVARRKV